MTLKPSSIKSTEDELTVKQQWKVKLPCLLNLFQSTKNNRLLKIPAS